MRNGHEINRNADTIFQLADRIRNMLHGWFGSPGMSLQDIRNNLHTNHVSDADIYLAWEIARM